MIRPPQGTAGEQVPEWSADQALTEQFDDELAKVRSASPADRRPPQRVAFDDTSWQPTKKIPDPGPVGRTNPATPPMAYADARAIRRAVLARFTTFERAFLWHWCIGVTVVYAGLFALLAILVLATHFSL
jgi:hypothetical protein